MQEKLTNEQRKLVEENYNLIYGFCALHKIDKDEYSDILSLLRPNILFHCQAIFLYAVL